MARFCALAVIGLASLGVSVRVTGEEAPNTRVYHLDEYTAAAIQRYPSLRAAKADIAVAHARLNEAKLSPFFQFQGRATFFVRPKASGTPIFSPDSQLPFSNPWGPGVELFVEGGIPIYTFGKYRAGKTAARAGIKTAEQERVKTLNQVVYDVRRAYFGTQLSLDLQSMISEGKGKLTKAVEKLEARLNADDPRVKQVDYWRLLSTLSEIESRESEALRLEASARVALEILSGIKPAIVPECALEPVKSEILELSEHLDRALANRPEVEQLNAAKSAREANLVVKRAGYLPDIILALAANFASTPIVTDIDNPFIIDRGNFRAAFAGLVAKWELDFAGTNARIKAAKAEIESLKAKTEEAHRGIELEVTALFEHLQDSKRRMNSWARAERETRKWFISAGQGYEVGTMSAKDLEDSIEGYLSARSKHLMAIAEYNLAIAGLEQATGVPLVDPKGWRPPGCGE
ncbi:MAG: TolC family protein [Deltaproteobacteria bacterium]|nr:TolC family protein [Deltaproteobacteria bacterium]